MNLERQPDYASLNKRTIKLKVRSLEETDETRVDRLRYREELPRPHHLVTETFWPRPVLIPVPRPRGLVAETFWPQVHMVGGHAVGGRHAPPSCSPSPMTCQSRDIKSWTVPG